MCACIAQIDHKILKNGKGESRKSLPNVRAAKQVLPEQLVSNTDNIIVGRTLNLVTIPSPLASVSHASSAKRTPPRMSSPFVLEPKSAHHRCCRRHCPGCYVSSDRVQNFSTRYFVVLRRFWCFVGFVRNRLPVPRIHSPLWFMFCRRSTPTDG